MASSGSGFQVDPQTLKTLATVLVNIGSDLNTIHAGRDQLQGAVTANYQSVDNFPGQAFKNAGSALCNFAGDWSNGIAQLNKESGDLATALKQAASAYSTTDQSLAKAIGAAVGSGMITVTYDYLTELSSELDAQMDLLKSCIQDLQRCVEEVAGTTWESVAADEFVLRYAQWQSSAAQIMDSGLGMAKFVTAAAKAYQDTDQQLAKGFQS